MPHPLIGTGRSLLGARRLPPPLLGIPNLRLWLKPGTGTYQDATLTTPAVLDTDRVGGEQDQSGGGNHLAQATLANKEFFAPAALFGQPTVRCYGAAELKAATAAFLDNPLALTVFAVVRTYGTAPTQEIIGKGDQGNDAYWGLYGGGRYWVFQQTNAIHVSWDTGQSFNDSVPRVLVARRNGPTIDLRVNGASLGAASVGGGAPNCSNAFPVSVGSFDPLVAPHSGDRSELAVWDRYLTDAECALVEAYAVPRLCGLTMSTVFTGGLVYNAWPGSCLLANGNILATFSDGTGHMALDQVVMTSQSTDGGQTWSAATQVRAVAGHACTTAIGIGQLVSGAILLPYTETDYATIYLLKVTISTDNGATWPNTYSVALPAGYTYPGELYGRILEVTPGGTILLPLYSTKPGSNYESFLMQSVDGGQNWTKKAVMFAVEDASNGYTETALVVLANGNYLAVSRKTTPPAQLLYSSRSADGGATWSAPVFICAGLSPELIQLPGGDVLLFYALRSATNPNDVCFRRSHDNGATWGGYQVLYTGVNGDLGYPSVLQLPNGKLNMLWYDVPHNIRSALFTPPAA